MQQKLRTWKGEVGGRVWLSALIAAIEDAARPDPEKPRLPAQTIAQFRTQLALPAAVRLYPVSSLRH